MTRKRRNRLSSSSSGRFSTEQDVIEMCGMLQRGLAEGVDQLLVSLGKKYNTSTCMAAVARVFKPTPTSSSPSGNTVTTRRTDGINTNNEEAMNANNPLRASMDTAGASARRASIGDDGHTLSKNGTLKFDASLIVPIPSRPVVPSSGLPAGVSAYYFNSCNRAVKAPGLYDRQYDPQLYWPEPVVCLAHEGSPIRPLSSRNEMSEVLDDRYLSDLLSLYRHRFPMRPPPRRQPRRSAGGSAARPATELVQQAQSHRQCIQRHASDWALSRAGACGPWAEKRQQVPLSGHRGCASCKR